QVQGANSEFPWRRITALQVNMAGRKLPSCCPSGRCLPLC
ncbi:GTPBP1 isoform 14, partial [Pongo abelii]